MGNMMSIIFTVMFYGFPSGLNIYFISSTLLGMLQQWYVTEQLKKTVSNKGSRESMGKSSLFLGRNWARNGRPVAQAD